MCIGRGHEHGTEKGWANEWHRTSAQGDFGLSRFKGQEFGCGRNSSASKQTDAYWGKGRYGLSSSLASGMNSGWQRSAMLSYSTCQVGVQGREVGICC